MNSFYFIMLARLILVIGGLNYLVMLFFKQSLINYLHYPVVMQAFTLAIGLSALYFMFNRDYYLPFLGSCVIPVSGGKPEGELKSIPLTGLPPNTNVIFWAAKSNKNKIPNPMDAYGDFSNSGITQSDKNGNAVLQVNCPAAYTVSKFGVMKRDLPKHVHYRYELPQYRGIFSSVMTKYITEGC
jgi:uncharacterized membrane protein YuzA (DUF378 family)